MTREQIICTVRDLAIDFLVYDRKEDEDLPLGAIEEALASEEITCNEIVEVFRERLEELLGESA